jgi:hypothetical protein
MLTPKDLLNDKDYREYQLIDYPFNLSILYAALKEKLREDPDYEVWVPLVYYKLVSHMADKERNPVVAPYNVFISNKGSVVSLRRKEPLILATMYGDGGYEVVPISIPGKYGEKLAVHRALCCAFIPPLDELKLEHPKDLQVNHRNGIKSDNELTNLEWETPSGNTLHAHANGLASVMSGWDDPRTVPVKGTLLVSGHKGFQFVLAGFKDITSYGFDCSSVYLCCKGEIKWSRGCSWEYASADDISTLPKVIPDDIKEIIRTLDPLTTYEIEATNLKTGEVYTLTGGRKEMIKRGFIPTCVYDVMTGKRNKHKGYTFKKVVLGQCKRKQ